MDNDDAHQAHWQIGSRLVKSYQFRQFKNECIQAIAYICCVFLYSSAFLPFFANLIYFFPACESLSFLGSSLEMDGSEKVGSYSLITGQLFGPKQSPPSSSPGIFSSIFPPPSGVHRQAGTQAWHKQQEIPVCVSNGGAYENLPKYFHEERAEPSHLSSSIYYEGQEIYSWSSRSAGTYSIFKDGGEDDQKRNNSDTASRGNWWQGSLYY